MDKVNEVVYDSSSLEETLQVYQTWSITYDKDNVDTGYHPSIEVGKMFVKYGMNSDVVLDLGGGTASIVEIAREAGFQNTFDILDASLSMLVLGEKKELKLRNIIRHFVQDDGILPLKDESYDIVTCAGAFVSNHIPPTAVKGIFNVIKLEGLLICTIRNNTIKEYKDKFDGTVKELIDAGKIEIVEKQDFCHYQNIEKKNIKSDVIVFRRIKK